MSKAENFIQNCTRNCSNEMESPLYANPKLNFYPWLTPDQARKTVEITKEEIYEWLLNHNDYITVNDNITSYNMEKLVEDLKQAMKDE